VLSLGQDRFKNDELAIPVSFLGTVQNRSSEFAGKGLALAGRTIHPASSR
jgi:hypothetical protein